MLIFFDYTFYRVATIFYRWDGTSGIRAKAVVTLFVGAIIMYPILTICVIIIGPGNFSEEEKTIGYYLCLAIVIVCTVYSYIRYNESRFKALQERYQNEGLCKKRMKGLLIIVLLFIVLFYAPILLILMGAKLGHVSS